MLPIIPLAVPLILKSRFGIIPITRYRHQVVEFVGVFPAGHPLAGAAMLQPRDGKLERTAAHRVLAELLRAEGETA